jgi:hypothetical protein
VIKSQPEVESTGNRIILHFDSLEDALQLLSPWHGANRRAEVAEEIHRALQAIGVRMELNVKGHTVAELGLGDLRGSALTLLGLAR